MSTHPGEDRDTDSEDESDKDGKQFPVPIQDEPIVESVEADNGANKEKEGEMEQE